jgi:tight adherence protein B
MSRRVSLAGALVALLLPATAAADVELRSVDAKDYPTVRVTVVTAEPTRTAPTLTENGERVPILAAENLGRAKSVVLAVDRSQSMRGEPLEHAVAAARSFIQAKPAPDQIAVVTFATQAVFLTDFSTATIDASSALRSIAIDSVQGTTLYDALVLSAGSLAEQELPGRVIILVTDGNETRSEASLSDAIEAARAADAAVYVVAIEGPQFSPEPLRELASATGGTYFGASDSASLTRIYGQIASELKRTWLLEYPTVARPKEAVQVTAAADGESAFTRLVMPDVPAAEAQKPSGLLPVSFYRSGAGAAVIGFVVGAFVFLAIGLAFALPRGSWVRERLAPHVPGAQRQGARRKPRRERFGGFKALFRTTERAFGHLRHWRSLEFLLERADVPLRAVELIFISLGLAFGLGLLAATAAAPTLAILLALVVGGAVPYGVVWFKAKRRRAAFDEQLPDLLVTMAASLKAGHSFRQGIQTVVEEGRPPASKEFNRVLTETTLGRPMDEALNEMARRAHSKDFDFVITAVTIQRQVGGSLAGLFDMVSDTVRQRQQFARKIKSLTAMGRMSAYVLIGLPFFLALALTALNPEYMAPLYHTSAGHKLIGLGLGMMAVGAVILKKMVSFKG